jgi:protoheme IX farnesyltransferase
VSATTSYPSAARTRGGVSAWIELGKPRIVSLVLFTGLPALLLAGGAMPPPRVFWGAIVGIALAAASGAAFNHYFDRDIDALMVRTRSRPLPAGLVPAAGAAALGLTLAWLAWVVLCVTCNPLAAMIAMASIFYYAVVYTVWLKRRTSQNIVIGGAAGASAPLIAWTAVTGHVGLPSMLMAAIVFLWTPPHFWALSLYRRDDYLRAGLPMLPVTHGEPATRRAILGYAVVLVAVTLLVAPLAGLGTAYVVAAALLGGVFVLEALRLYRAHSAAAAIRLFRFSILYLFALFLMMLVDALWGLGGR